MTLGCTSATIVLPERDRDPPADGRVHEPGGQRVHAARTLSIEESGGALDLLSNHFLCITPDIAGARATRARCYADAAFSYDVTGTVNLEIAVVQSVNGG